LRTFFSRDGASSSERRRESEKLWLGLEDHVLTYADSTDQRLSVFTAPVLGLQDPAHRGLHIPLRFWKVAAWQVPNSLVSAGFILDQTNLVETRAGVITTPPLGAFRISRYPLPKSPPSLALNSARS
jgi:endonuclease G